MCPLKSQSCHIYHWRLHMGSVVKNSVLPFNFDWEGSVAESCSQIKPRFFRGCCYQSLSVPYPPLTLTLHTISYWCPFSLVWFLSSRTLKAMIWPLHPRHNWGDRNSRVEVPTFFKKKMSPHFSLKDYCLLARMTWIICLPEMDRRGWKQSI